MSLQGVMSNIHRPACHNICTRGSFAVMILRISILILSMLAFSCSFEGKEKKATPPAPVVSGTIPTTTRQDGGMQMSFQILPQEAMRGTVFFTVAPTIELQRGVITWTVNGAPVREVNAAQFKASDAMKGDVVQAVVKIHDNTYYSNSVTIMNSPPEIKTLKLLPEVFKTGDTLSVEATADDRDGDAVTVAYEWTKNGVIVGREARMPEAVKRGDAVVVKLVPYDGTDYGVPIVHERIITNMPPSIQEHVDYSFDGTTCTYQVRATDVDGDALSFKLETAVEGMAIDRVTGLLIWQVPISAQKKQTVHIAVEDGNGGVARYSLNISLR